MATHVIKTTDRDGKTSTFTVNGTRGQADVTAAALAQRTGVGVKVTSFDGAAQPTRTVLGFKKNSGR